MKVEIVDRQSPACRCRSAPGGGNAPSSTATSTGTDPQLPRRRRRRPRSSVARRRRGRLRPTCPQIVIRTPRRTSTISAGGAVFGSVGPARPASTWQRRLRRLDGRPMSSGSLQLSQAGSGDTRAGSAGRGRAARRRLRRHRHRARSAGRWTWTSPAPATSRGLDDGPLDVHVAGSGDVQVQGGQASDMAVADRRLRRRRRFGGVADSLKASIAGSGDVRARRGHAARSRKTVMGSGGGDDRPEPRKSGSRRSALDRWPPPP